MISASCAARIRFRESLRAFSSLPSLPLFSEGALGRAPPAPDVDAFAVPATTDAMVRGVVATTAAADPSRGIEARIGMPESRVAVVIAAVAAGAAATALQVGEAPLFTGCLEGLGDTCAIS